MIEKLGSIELLDFEKLSPNSVVFVKVPKELYSESQKLSLEFAYLVSRHEATIKAKNISLFLVDSEMEIATIPESEMNRNGWFKQ